MRWTSALCFWASGFFAAASIACIVTAQSCGSMDATELERIRAVTCPSVCAAYADAVDAGVEITPEEQALIGGCGCGNE